MDGNSAREKERKKRKLLENQKKEFEKKGMKVQMEYCFELVKKNIKLMKSFKSTKYGINTKRPLKNQKWKTAFYKRIWQEVNQDRNFQRQHILTLLPDLKVNIQRIKERSSSKRGELSFFGGFGVILGIW